jgi:hypothetical protein
MKTSTISKLSLFAAVALSSTAALAQRDGPDWNAANFDVQRTNWMRADKYISNASMAKPGFTYLWKQKIEGAKGLSAPIMMGTFIGWKGFKDLVLFQGSDGNLYTYDSDLGVPYFDKKFDVKTTASAVCTMSTIGAPGRNSSLTPANPLGRNMAAGYHSRVGLPGEGVPVEVRTQAPAPVPPPAALTTAVAATAARATPPPAAANGRGPTPMYTITADGVLHISSHDTGNEYEKPTPFVPAGSSLSDISAVEKVVYVATYPGCGSSPNTLFAMDRNDPMNPTVTKWKPETGTIMGTPAFSTTGKLYVTTGKSIVILEPKTLAAKTFATNDAGFVSTPVLFTPKGGKEMIAAGTADSKLVVMDAETGAVVATAAAGSVPTALATWEDMNGDRYILASDKTKQRGSVMAFKMSGGALSSAWTSVELEAPGTPIIVNGVVFALATGETRGTTNPMARAKGKPAVLYAFDGHTGKDLWNSGTTVTSPVTTSGLTTGSSQVFFATADDTLYAFGFPIDHQYPGDR